MINDAHYIVRPKSPVNYCRIIVSTRLTTKKAKVAVYFDNKKRSLLTLIVKAILGKQ